jgi:glycosyltransferase involved in cell wall biosynthesis
MIRIVHIISNLGIGGAEVMLARLVSGMDSSRFQNAVVSLTDRGQLGDRIESCGASVYCLEMKRGRPDIRSLPVLVQWLKAYKPTIVQSWLYHADLISVLAARCLKSSRLLWNVRCSNMHLRYYPIQTRCVRRVLCWCSGMPDAVVVNSETGKRQHEKFGYRPRRWAYIPNGFDTNRYRPDSIAAKKLRKELHLAPDVKLVALVARYDPMKDHSTFLAAAKIIAVSKPQVHFVLAGENTTSLSTQVAAAGLRDCIHLLGLRHDVEYLFAGVDITCLSSAFGEGFSNVLGESMACGVPCVATDVGDARAIIGQTGLVVPPRDPAALASAIVSLIDRPSADRLALGLAARIRIESRYSLSRAINNYQSLYEEVAAEKRNEFNCPTRLPQFSDHS